jgi:hypothetical protein
MGGLAMGPLGYAGEARVGGLGGCAPEANTEREAVPGPVGHSPASARGG